MLFFFKQKTAYELRISYSSSYVCSSDLDVDLRSYFTQLCESLSASMIHGHDRVSIAVTADGSAVHADISVSLGLIVTELVINALKHAFPGDRGGQIIVDYNSNGSDWALSVSDNGVGTPETLAGAQPGLGRRTVDALANHLGAADAPETPQRDSEGKT